MKFLRDELEQQFHERLHHETRALILALDYWSKVEKLPEVEVTSVSRKPEWYAENGQKFKASWHLYDCAVDVRNKHYSPEHLAKVEGFLKARCTIGPWELITYAHGTGPHIHVARRDFVWRVRFERAQTQKEQPK